MRFRPGDKVSTPTLGIGVVHGADPDWPGRVLVSLAGFAFPRSFEQAELQALPTCGQAGQAVALPGAGA